MKGAVTQAEFARHKGVHRSTVTRWIERGRITLDEKGRIDVAAAERQLQETESLEPHHIARKEQIEADKAAGAAQAGAPEESRAEDLASVSAQLKRETLRLQAAKARKATLEAEHLSGALVDRGELDYLMTEIGTLLRKQSEQLADRYSGPIAAMGGDANAIHKALEDAGREIANELAALMRRKSGEWAREDAA